ncbi:hypothetical protein, partial [Bifidobacterium boum]|uniref:hypothetical protein n=1 Tax=Bifidobacterium boum TaxID=78343 RepID=UPI001F1C6CA0
IPNPEAKTWHGDGTASDRMWESSTPPHQHSTKGGGTQHDAPPPSFYFQNTHQPAAPQAQFCEKRTGERTEHSHQSMLMYGKEASNRKQEIDRQHYTIPNQRPKDKHCGKI